MGTIRSKQWLLILGTISLFALLYFGCDTQNKKQRELEMSRALNLEATSPQFILRGAKQDIGLARASEIEILEQKLSTIEEDSAKLETLKTLASKWYENGQGIASGIYAQQVAELENTETAWSIAGTTFALGLKQTEVEKNRQFAFSRSIKAFENAKSINPENIDHSLNLAIAYTEYPPKDNPMQGILMLRELNQEYPESSKVLNQLGRLSIKTGQWDNAKKRLQQAYEQDKNNPTTICLLAQVYTELKEATLASQFSEKCNFLNK